ncbi:M17 family metallopeptidase [Mycoplasma sp. ATU-Cv-508]|uniref:M17 family metallopeptidase n=1 Tax=Mycoplasma sp. ATU-Cv-508 TaxID=2048001 RepID=UPI0013749E72
MCFKSKTADLFLGPVQKVDYWKIAEHLGQFFSRWPAHQPLQVDLGLFQAAKLTESELYRLIVWSLAQAKHPAYKLSVKPKKVPDVFSLTLVDSQGPSSEKNAQLENLLTVARAANLARDLQDTPPNLLNSEQFADKIRTELANVAELKLEILDQKAIQALGMNLLLAVNAGSPVEPRVVVIEYLGAPESQEKIALVGKGITFDSGGYSLKPSNFQSGMKFDMSGAAAVCATMKALAELKPAVNVVAVACLTDNRIGKTATLVESVVKSLDGKFVEIEDTDAEGRLVLADGISYAIKHKNVSEIIDVATLTGAASRALGPWFTGVMANDASLMDRFGQASQISKERIWPLPVIREHREIMRKSQTADLSNFPGEVKAGMSTAAAFLFEFSQGKPHLHLDIAGTAYAKKRGQGVMVKTLLTYLTNRTSFSDHSVWLGTSGLLAENKS